MNNPTCAQCDCVAGCQSRERLCPNVEQPVDAAYQEAVSLAKALFKEHYSNEPDYANGKSIWGVCGTTAGVISQIDNMVTGLSRKLSAIAQPVQPAADLDRYITANYPNAEGNTLTERVISALETMDFALGMKELEQPVQPLPAITITKGERDGGWQEFGVNGHAEFIRAVARMEEDKVDLPLGKLVEQFLLSANIAQAVQP